MTKSNLLKSIFEHQKMVSQEMRTHLGGHLTEGLKDLFEENETLLEELENQDTVTPEDLSRLQNLWERLTHHIGKTYTNLEKSTQS